jgi:glutamate/tyrosine decarboxylase-like PLP-dependent enzyme
MERADSLALDLHKWMYMPYEVGCVLVRNEAQHRRTFSLVPAYIKRSEGRGPLGASLWFDEYGLQFSRSFRALKVWMSLKEHGIQKYARMIQQNIAQARYLASLIRATAELELLAPVASNVVCFRFRLERLDDTALNQLNQELTLQLQENGVVMPSGTTLAGKYAIRVAITNHRSRREDFDLFVREVLRLGKQLNDFRF